MTIVAFKDFTFGTISRARWLEARLNSNLKRFARIFRSFRKDNRDKREGKIRLTRGWIFKLRVLRVAKKKIYFQGKQDLKRGEYIFLP